LLNLLTLTCNCHPQSSNTNPVITDPTSKHRIHPPHTAKAKVGPYDEPKPVNNCSAHLLGSRRSSGSGCSCSCPLLVPRHAPSSITVPLRGPVEGVSEPALGAAPGRRGGGAEGERGVHVLRLRAAAGGVGPREPQPQREVRPRALAAGGAGRRAAWRGGAGAEVVPRLEERRRRRHRSRRRWRGSEGLRLGRLGGEAESRQ